MGAVALFVHHERPEAISLARAAVEWLVAKGHEPRLPAEDADVIAHPELGRPGAELCEALELAVCIGGDGTMLRTVDVVGDAGVPVLGVNVGQMGYLTELEPTELFDALEQTFAGEHRIDERMRLAVRVERDGETELLSTAALNEAVVEKTPMGHTVRLRVSIRGEFWTTYAADGLIVATPTGSTAYSFSARGPIVDPLLRAVVLTPVSPHMLFDRALVLEPDDEVRLEVLGARQATLSVDGRNQGALDEGDVVVCTSSPYPARFVTFGRRDFHQILKMKFRLSDR
jgi:NAD+ kinase